MQEVFELVHVDGRSQVWSPVVPAMNIVRLSGEPELGDFMVEHGNAHHFLRRELTRVTIKDVTGDQLQIDLGPDELPNWFSHLMHTRQINNNGVMNLNGQELKAGMVIVFDGQTARVESEDGTVLSTH